VGYFERKFPTEGGVANQPLLVSENYSDCPFVCYQNIRNVLFGFVTKHACDRQTDRQMDVQNYDSQDHASIAARAIKQCEATS